MTTTVRNDNTPDAWRRLAGITLGDLSESATTISVQTGNAEYYTACLIEATRLLREAWQIRDETLRRSAMAVQSAAVAFYGLCLADCESRVRAAREHAARVKEFAAVLGNHSDRIRQASPGSVCDNTSVGIIVTNAAGELLLIERAKFPFGYAPVAGHIDEHGTAADAARAEVAEEVGLTTSGLTQISRGWRNNACRRHPGPAGTGHLWSVYACQIDDTDAALTLSADETRGAIWANRERLLSLAANTIAAAYGHSAEIGIEPVWLRFLAEAGQVPCSPEDLDAVEALAARGEDR